MRNCGMSTFCFKRITSKASMRIEDQLHELKWSFLVLKLAACDHWSFSQTKSDVQ